MAMVAKFSNFPDELSENDELREYELSGSDCNYFNSQMTATTIMKANVPCTLATYDPQSFITLVILTDSEAGECQSFKEFGKRDDVSWRHSK